MCRQSIASTMLRALHRHLGRYVGTITSTSEDNLQAPVEVDELDDFVDEADVKGNYGVHPQTRAADQQQ